MVGNLNDLVEGRQKNGWTLVPPILLQPSVFNKDGFLIFEGCYTLTFVK